MTPAAQVNGPHACQSATSSSSHHRRSTQFTQSGFPPAASFATPEPKMVDSRSGEGERVPRISGKQELTKDMCGEGGRGLYQMRQQKTSEMIGKLLTFRNVVLLAAAAKCQYSYADFKIQLRCVSSRKNARGRAPNEVSKRCIRNVTQEI